MRFTPPAIWQLAVIAARGHAARSAASSVASELVSSHGRIEDRYWRCALDGACRWSPEFAHGLLHRPWTRGRRHPRPGGGSHLVQATKRSSAARIMQVGLLTLTFDQVSDRGNRFCQRYFCRFAARSFRELDRAAFYAAGTDR